MSKELYTCDGSCYRYNLLEVRVLPTGGSSNAIFCRQCFEQEIRYRIERNKEVCKPFDLPKWEDLEVYKSY